jgi:hypothetical protein
MNSLADLVLDLERGEIVQIDPAYGPDQMGGMFMVVEEVKDWGILGWIANWAVGSYGPFFVRVPFNKFRRTGGRVQWDLAKLEISPTQTESENAPEL